MKLILGTAAHRAVVGGLLILGVMVILAVWSVGSLVATAQRLVQWESILARLDDTVTASSDAKQALQRYFQADDPAALEEYRADFVVIKRRLDDLRSEIADEPQLQSSHEALVAETATLHDWLQLLVEVHQTQGATERRRMVSQQTGPTPAERVNQATAELKSLVTARQQRDSKSLPNLSAWTIGVILFGSATAALVSFLGAWSVLRELAQRRRMESQLQERESRLRAILDSEPECVKLLAADGTLLEMNAAGLAMVEADSAQQVCGKKVDLLVTPEHRGDFQALTDRVFLGESGSLEFEIVGLKGTRRWLETHATPLREPDGRIASLLSITRDITERKQSEDRLRASEQRFATVFHSSPIGICISTLEDGRFLDANKAFLKTENLALEDILGKTSLEMGYWPDPDDRRRMVQQLKERGSLINWEVGLRLKDGSTSYSLWSLERITIDGQDCILTMLSDITDRKQAEASLRQQERRFRALIEHSSDAIALVGREGAVEYLSPSAQRVLSYRQDEMIGRVFAEFVHPDDLASANEFFSDLLARPQATGSIQARARHKDGSWRWMDAVCTNLFAEPSVQALVVNYRDITERKRAEAALRESEEHLRLTTSHSNTGLWDWDLRTNRVHYSTIWKSQIGYAEDEIAEHHSEWESHLHPDDLGQALATVKEYLDNPGAAYRSEFRFRHKDGSYRWILSQGSLLRDEQGRPWRLLGSHIDITERKQAEMALREAQIRFQTIFDLAPVGVILIDPANVRVVECNEIAARQLGYSPDEFVQLSVFDFEAAETPAETRRHAERVLRDGRDEFETKHRTKSGEIRDVFVTTQVIELSGQTLCHCIFQDLTDRKHAEAKVREQERQLATLISSLPGFAYRCGNDAEYSIEFVSEGIGDLTGFPAEEFRQHHQNIGPLIHSADQTRVWNEIQAALHAGRAYEFSYRIRTAAGAEKWVWERGQGVYAPTGEFLALEGFVMDITAHKQTELALRASEERFRSFMDHIPAKAFIKDAEGRYVFGNQCWAEQFSSSSETLLGKTDPDLWPERIAEQFQASDREVLAGGRSVEVFHALERVPGELSWFQVLKFPIQQESAARLVGGIALDVTRTKQIEESLRQTAKRLNTLLATSQAVGSSLNLDNLLNDLLLRIREAITNAELCTIYIYDPHTKLLAPRACLSYEAESHLKIRLKPGESVSGRVFESRRSVLLRTAEEVRMFRGTPSPENEQLIARVRSGATIQSTLCVPLIGSNQKVIGTISLGSTHLPFTDEDVSLLEGIAAQATVAIRNAELFDEVRTGRERLQSLSRQLISAQETERRHIAGELHDEVGQVLTAVGLKLHSLKDVCGESAQAELESGLNLIDHAVEQVRDLSLNLRPQMLDVLGLDAAIRWCVEQHRERAGWKVHLNVQLESRLPSPLETTCFRLVQAALTNVARHARATEVWVEVLQRDGDLELIVRDNGVGFDYHSVRQRSEQGDSFGISGMRERVELAGGRFHIVSAFASGTSIQAYFPLDTVAESTPPRWNAENSTAAER